MATPRFELFTGPTNIEQHPEANSQSFLRGDLVYLSSSQVTVCNGTGIGASGIYGVAMKNAVNNSVNAMTPVSVISPDQIWRCFPTSTITPSTDLSIGVDYQIKQTAVGAGELTDSAGTDAVVRSWLYKNSTGATAGDPVYISFDSTACQASEG